MLASFFMSPFMPHHLQKVMAAVACAGVLRTTALQPQPAAARPDRRLFTKEQVSAHAGRTDDDGVWVTYKGGVYDVSTFAAQHPGGIPKTARAAPTAARSWPS